jgi:hypothetical protein
MKRLLTAVCVLLCVSTWAPVHATCSSGFAIYLAGQIPDFTFTSGVPATISYSPWYVSLPSTINGSCGIFARSLTPGVSIQGTYGCPAGGCLVAPPGEWAPVGDAYATPSGTVAQKLPIPLIFDGTAPAGTQGTIEIGVRDNDVGIPSHALMGVGNIYVESASPPATWFGVGSNVTNVSGNRLYLDHPYLNGNPSANLFVSHLRNPGGSTSGTLWNHPTAVSYDSQLGRWTIVNTDGAAMPTGLGFGVRYDPAAELYCTPGVPGAYYSITLLNDAAYDNPYATILVTPIDGAARTPAVAYRAPHWVLVHSDNSGMQGATCYNVKVIPFSMYRDDPLYGELSGYANTSVNWGTGVDVGGNGSGHTSGSFRYMQFPWAEDRPFNQMMVTKNLSPPGSSRSYDSAIVGASAPRAFFVGGRWAVVNEDGTTMPLDRTFNVWAPCVASAWYPDGDGDGWGGPGNVLGSCGPIAGYSFRSGDCDDADPTKYPGSREINDGKDNQCPGESGYGDVDEVLAFYEFSDRETFCWPSQTGASGYELARSSVRDFATCDDVRFTTGTCLVESLVPAPGQASYYLVHVWGPFSGSWGVDSEGVPRDPCP